ncbi:MULTISPECIES: hypothetical protein [Bacillus]|nr:MULTISPECIES: hypothetical protein [Bacillus]EEK74533.1 hypothetical protein bcere0007_8960 [Bacillus mycoides]MBK5426054.1 hypothetical protein [Bacillus sp. TH30]MBK5472934.1 hypothetical protein [Bacillus sp. TH19]WOA58438.1 hypothetical protein RVY74_04945 [Bacillus mycoides]WOA64479.1 hypothetical protein RVY75_05200 [Bacillus mycoides]
MKWIPIIVSILFLESVIKPEIKYIIIGAAIIAILANVVAGTKRLFK